MKWTVISRKEHLNKAVCSKRDYSYAMDRLLAPICIGELRLAVSTSPLLFGRQKETIELFSMLGFCKKIVI